MSRTVSTKQTSTHTSRCDECGLWFESVHFGPGGRYLCRMCLDLEGGNRSSGGTVQVAAGQARRR
jgi:hypothetical protein